MAIVSLGSPVVMDFSPHLGLTISTNQLGNSTEEERSCAGAPDGNLQKNYKPFSVLLMPRSLLIFKDKAYSGSHMLVFVPVLFHLDLNKLPEMLSLSPEYMHGIKDCAVQRCDTVSTRQIE